MLVEKGKKKVWMKNEKKIRKVYFEITGADNTYGNTEESPVPERQVANLYKGVLV